ncbi:X-Pro dipeptidyl-peptidase S15 family protein (plasmid) [Roseomonas mucosa]|uniref:CocE/NonD family hydrolase n=1 Tax=Roseomonas mucosa TaxID=207340 RepID=UPI00220BC943|nr:CocE/NonD family hydrolase [Roseomonas mucosa]QDJ11572.1 X-Pro dipeptidyl-peptidase S15 family protein [Roseomonas mucosa]
MTHRTPLAVKPPRSLDMRLSDGTTLRADIWQPDAPGRFPVLLMRQPYGRRIASTLVFAHPAWYVAQGYMVVVQDVRGTGDSEGRFRLFAHEEQDGAEAAAWAADLPGGNGRLGMYGFSYQAVTQFLALAGGAPLGAMAPAMAGWDIRSDWAWEGGAFPLAANLGWGAQMGWIKARHDGDAEAAAAFEAAARAMPLASPGRAMPEFMRRHGALSHYPDWLGNPAPGPYWDAFSPRVRLAGQPVAVPMLHVGGWYDQMLMGTLDGHADISARSSTEQRLVVGPWTHLPWGRRVGAVDFGPAASSPIDAMQVAWFDRHLKGMGEAAPALTLFDLGRRAWHDLPAWPAVREHALFLGGTGRAAATSTDGTLAAEPGTAALEAWVQDPWRPVPSLGGHNAQPGGMQDRAGLDDRADVATFTAPPLEAPLALCGRVAAEVWVEADQPSFDLSVVLSMVAPDGRAWNLTQGHACFDGSQPGPCRVALRATCATVPAGHALRLSLAGAAFPAFAVNPGTGSTALDATAAEERIITLMLRHGGATPSRVILPEWRDAATP